MVDPSLARFERLFANSAVAVVVIGADGTVVHSNSAFQAMVGGTSHSLSGPSFVAFFSEPEQPRLARILLDLHRGVGDEAQEELKFVRADGGVGVAVASCTAMTDRAGARYVVVLLQDITALRQSERSSATSLERLALLGRSGDLLKYELDVQERMQAFAEMSVPAFCDLCAVFLRNGDDLWLRGFASTSEQARVSLGALTRLPINLEQSSPPATALRENRIVRIEHLESELENLVDDVRRQVAIAATGVTSVICAPLANRDNVFGTVLFGYTNAADLRYSEDDEWFASELASRASGSLANALRFEDEHKLATRLQYALLPGGLPDVHCAEIATRYRPAVGTRLGGDWYDVFTLADQRVVFVVGDVVGHGIDAAIAMSAIRQTLRAYALDESDPAVLLSKVNRYLCQQPRRQVATCAVVLGDLATGHLTIATAGHLPLLIRAPDGSVAMHGEGLGPPIGASAASVFRTTTAVLADGGVLILYTDGLVERRTESLELGLGRLSVRAAQAVDPDLEAYADALADVVERQETLDSDRTQLGPSDDVAILVVRRVADRATTMLNIEYPAAASELAKARSDVRRFLARQHIGGPTLQDLVLAVSECASNAVEHAYRPGERGVVQICATCDADIVEISIRDFGRWRSQRFVGGGRGFPLLDLLVDSRTVHTDESGTIVTLRHRLPQT